MLRRLIVVILMLGMAGTGAELLLLEHTEDLWQWTPLVLFAVALPVAGWLLLAPGAANCSGLSDPDAGLRCFGFRRPVAPLPGKSRVRSRDASIRHPARTRPGCSRRRHPDARAGDDDAVRIARPGGLLSPPQTGGSRSGESPSGGNMTTHKRKTTFAGAVALLGCLALLGACGGSERRRRLLRRPLRRLLRRSPRAARRFSTRTSPGATNSAPCPG